MGDISKDKKKFNYEGRYATKTLMLANAKLANVQATLSFLGTTQNLFILALLCSLYSKQTFKVHVGFEKHIKR